MPRAALKQLSELLGRLRDGLHARADRERRRRRASVRRRCGGPDEAAPGDGPHDRC